MLLLCRSVVEVDCSSSHCGHLEGSCSSFSSSFDDDEDDVVGLPRERAVDGEVEVEPGSENVEETDTGESTRRTVLALLALLTLRIQPSALDWIHSSPSALPSLSPSLLELEYRSSGFIRGISFSSSLSSASGPLLASRTSNTSNALAGGVEDALALALEPDGLAPSRLRHSRMASVLACGDLANQSDTMPTALQELQRVG